MRTALHLAAALSCGCAHYAPQPLDLSAAPAAYQARSLSDPALGSALDSLGVDTTLGWDDGSLAWAAWLMRPERARLAAEVRAAEAGVIAAGGRPAPGVESGVEGTFSGRDGTSPWAVALSGIFRIEFGGKRDARVARAKAAVLAARARAELVAWRFRARVRRRLEEVRAADSRVAASAELVVHAERVVAGYERRYGDGVVGALELARVRGDRDLVRLELLEARRQASEVESRLREESALPRPVRPTSVRRDPDLESLGVACGALDSLSRLALTRRLELAVVLAEYQESEGEVRIAAAQSWPDLELGPGLLFDHGAGKWTVGLGLPAVPTGYRGPLAQAIARRDVQAARVAEAQTAVLAEVEAAIQGCEAAQADFLELDRLRQGAVERLRAASEARDRGETDEVPESQARLELLRAAGRVIEASGRRRLNQLDLEAALGIWDGAETHQGEDTHE